MAAHDMGRLQRSGSPVLGTTAGWCVSIPTTSGYLIYGVDGRQSPLNQFSDGFALLVVSGLQLNRFNERCWLAVRRLSAWRVQPNLDR
jgi:hypothetical protein